MNDLFFTLKFEVIKLPYRMFLRKILRRFLTKAAQKQEVINQQPLQVSIQPGQQLELIQVSKRTKTKRTWYRA